MTDDTLLRQAATSAIRQAKAVAGDGILGAIVILIDDDGGRYTASTKMPTFLIQEILTREAERVGRQNPATVRVSAATGETIEVKKA